MLFDWRLVNPIGVCGYYVEPDNFVKPNFLRFPRFNKFTCFEWTWIYELDTGILVDFFFKFLQMSWYLTSFFTYLRNFRLLGYFVTNCVCWFEHTPMNWSILFAHSTRRTNSVVTKTRSCQAFSILQTSKKQLKNFQLTFLLRWWEEKLGSNENILTQKSSLHGCH